MSKANTEQLSLGLDQIPYSSLKEIGRIFLEGEKKYGKDNWKKGVGDKEYQTERWNHALNHLMLYKEGDTSEKHLAKVAWYCVTQLWLESNETNKSTTDFYKALQDIVDYVPDELLTSKPSKSDFVTIESEPKTDEQIKEDLTNFAEQDITNSMDDLEEEFLDKVYEKESKEGGDK